MQRTRGWRRLPSLCTLVLALAAPAAAIPVIDFEDVGLNLPIGSDFFYEGADGAGGFTSGAGQFSNTFTDFGGGFTGWDGWAYSQVADNTTPGFGNQFSAFAGGGEGGSATYGVAFTAAQSGGVSTIDFAGPTGVPGGYVTNTTYAALAMRDGDPFSKKFGGVDGTDEDWFRLTISGYDENDGLTGSVEVYLADYRFADPAQDYILDEWTWVDLSALGGVTRLDFVLTGSDIGQFGLNTPSYFALDGLVVPEPGTASLLALGLIGLARRRS